MYQSKEGYELSQKVTSFITLLYMLDMCEVDSEDVDHILHHLDRFILWWSIKEKALAGINLHPVEIGILNEKRG